MRRPGRSLRARSRFVGAAAALFLLCGRWTVAGLLARDLATTPFYYEVRFWAVVALAFGLLPTGKRVRERAPGGVYLALMLVFFGWVVLSSTWAPDAALALDKVYDIVLVAVATVSMARMLAGGAADAFAEGLWAGLLAFGSVLALVALASIERGGGGERLAVLGGGPNVFGRMMGYLALAALFFWRRQGRTWLYLPMAVVAVFLTLLSGSRGSFIGLVAGGLVFAFREIRTPGRLLIAVATGAALFFTLVQATEIGRTAVDEFYTRMQVQLVQQRYTSGREDIYRAALDLGRASPIRGAGLAAFPALGLGAYAHNVFLDAFCETGLVGLLLLAATCLAGILAGIRRAPLPDGVTAAAFVLIFVASQFSGGLYDGRGIFAFLIAALRIPAVGEPAAAERRRRRAAAALPAAMPHARSLRPAGVALAAAIAWSATAVATAPAMDGSADVRSLGASGDGRTDDGRALQTAIDTVARVHGVVVLPPGTYRFTATLRIPDGVHLAGSGVKATTLRYGGDATALAPQHPGTRSYAIGLRDLTLSTDTGAIGVDLDSVSTGEFENVSVVGFREDGFWLHSAVRGGAVYNRFQNVGVQGARIGYRLDGPSSNANTWVACRCNLCSGRGWDINDSNDNTVAYSQAEGGGVGFRVDATVAGKAAQNRFIGVRAEANEAGIEIASERVTDAVILAPWFGANREDIRDRGQRTLRYGTQGLQVVAAENVAQPFKLERTAGGGTEVPALVLRDAVSSTGTPVTLQIETERGAGHFVRGTRGGATYFDVDASGGVVARGAVQAAGFVHRQVTPPFGGRVPIDVASGEEQLVVATSGAPFTIENPSGGRAPGQELVVRVKNATRGSLERVDWGSDYKMAPWTSPAGGFSRAITFHCDGRSWVEATRTPLDVPN